MGTSNGRTLRSTERQGRRPGGGEAGVCQSWRRDVSGTDHYLSDGDILCVSLCDDRSVSITYNNTEVTQVFTDLPDKPLWVVLEIVVSKLETVPTGG